MNKKKFTGSFDKSGDPIYENDTLRIKSIDGEETEYEVKWSDYRKAWIGDNSYEMYDLSSKLFSEAKIVCN